MWLEEELRSSVAPQGVAVGLEVVVAILGHPEG